MGLEISRTQSKFGTKELIAAAAAIFVAGLGMVAAFTLQANALSPGITTVTPDNETDLGWAQTESGTGAVDYVNSPGAMNAAALQFSTTTEADVTRMRNNVAPNDLLSSINSMSYMTKKLSGDTGVAAVNLRLYIDTSGDGVFDDVLVYEPYYNATVTDNAWQTWSITKTSGLWWSNRGLTYNGKGGVPAGSYATNFTLSDVITAYPSTQVDEYGLGTGDGNAPWVVQADALTVNNSIFDFELVASQQPVKATNKDQCKDGGYMNFQTSYKNQGQCVSSVANKK